jgi:AcrR family transcriptional regulator
MAKNKASPKGQGGGTDVRDRILDAASDLFYKRGVRAVGVDLVIEKAGVAKASLYRHFSTKDDLIAAFVGRADLEFWATWNAVAEKHAGDPRAELDAHMGWIGERAARPDYRGCPQINVVAEFPEANHPARRIAKAHKQELRRRLKRIAEALNCPTPDELAGQLAVLINGAFVSTPIYRPKEAVALLRRAATALIAASGSAK